MGAEPWIYFVPYQQDFQLALEQLRDQEFKAGRYFPANYENFAEDFGGELPGSIDEAREMADADGTQSILDMERVADEADYSVVRRLTAEELQQYFGTAQPTKAIVEANSDFFDEIERGQGVCLPVFENGAKVAICFAGCSFD